MQIFIDVDFLEALHRTHIPSEALGVRLRRETRLIFCFFSVVTSSSHHVGLRIQGAVHSIEAGYHHHRHQG